MPTFQCNDCETQFEKQVAKTCNDGLHRCKRCRQIRERETFKARHPNYESPGSKNGDKKKGQRRWHLAKKYGMTSKEWQALYDSQQGKCAICRSKEATDVDHDHRTGSVRGMLCGSCNRGIGLLGDSYEVLQSAVAYLRP